MAKDNEQMQEQPQNQQPAKGKKSTTKKVLKYGLVIAAAGGVGYLAGNKEARGKVLDAGKKLWEKGKNAFSSKNNDDCPGVDEEIVEEAAGRDERNNNDRQWRNNNGGNNYHRDFNNNRK